MKQTAILMQNLKRFSISLLIIITVGMPGISPARAETPQKNVNAAAADSGVDSLLETLQESGDLASASTGETRLGAIQQTQLVASDAQRQAEFGWSVAISGNTAVVGARNDDPDLGSGPLANAGAAYVFVRSGSTWIQQAKLVARNAEEGDTFGVSVAIDGDTVVVGATGVDVDEEDDAGAAYVFVREGAAWKQKARLVAKNPAAEDNFGSSVAIDGITIVVGADSHDLGGVLIDSGAAYVFIQRSGAWDQKAKLVSSDIGVGDYFGTSVAISDKRIVVGATQANLGGTRGNGSAYVFKGGGNTWVQEAQLAAEDGRDGDFFGQSVAIFNDTVVVGALFKDPDLGSGRITNAGAAYVFAPRGGAWKQQARLIPEDASSFSYFGQSVAIYGNKIAVGANGRAQAGYTGAGATYLFARIGKEWNQQTLIVADFISDDDSFGNSVSISGDRVLVGAKGRDQGSLRSAGEAFVYQLGQVLLPDTGFPPGKITLLPKQPPAKAFQDLGELWLEIPALNIQAPIIGVPQSGSGWDVHWLWDQAGYLEGTAFPTWNGNTGIAAHTYLPSGTPGPFANLEKLVWGERVVIHGWGQRYIYEVRTISRVWPDDLSVLQHEEYDWITLISCDGFDEGSGRFQQRLVVRAVLITVEDP
jgi:LPXTG-site transpeptidase (sortase) family protein